MSDKRLSAKERQRQGPCQHECRAAARRCERPRNRQIRVSQLCSQDLPLRTPGPTPAFGAAYPAEVSAARSVMGHSRAGSAARFPRCDGSCVTSNIRAHRQAGSSGRSRKSLAPPGRARTARRSRRAQHRRQNAAVRGLQYSCIRFGIIAVALGVGLLEKADALPPATFAERWYPDVLDSALSSSVRR